MARKDSVKLALELLFDHFEKPYFPRTISTKKLKNAQVTVFSIDEIIQYFEESEWLDCRVSLFGKEEAEQVKPNAIFIDLDDKDSLEFVKTRIRELIGGIPLIISTGNGYAIIQPVQMKSMKGISIHNLSDYEVSTKFLKFSKKYLTNDKADPCNNPSLKNCMIRVPYTINSKNNSIVKFKESWDNHRVSVRNIPFKNHIEQESKQQLTLSHVKSIDPKKFLWIEKLLMRKIDDHRNFLLFDVCRYLINIKKLSLDQATNLACNWLDSTKYPRSRILSEMKRALKDGKFPRKFETIQNENQEVSEYLTSHGIGIAAP